MIDIYNQNLTNRADRANIVRRAFHTQPYFYRMDFSLAVAVGKQLKASATLGINRDFYLTEMQGNFDQMFNDTGALYDATLYTEYNRSLWRYVTNRKLQTGFVMTDARFRVPIGNQIFVDRQFENFPILIQNNDQVYGEVESRSAVGAARTAKVILKGFSIIRENSYVPPMDFDEINKALDRQSYYQFFKIDVAEQGHQLHVLENDNMPRLILGFGAINSTGIKANVSEATVIIDDLSRHLRLTDDAIPLEFIAPRLTCLADEHLYYLPIEYYWQPLGRLQFTVDNTWINALTPAGFQLVVLTRTV